MLSKQRLDQFTEENTSEILVQLAIENAKLQDEYRFDHPSDVRQREIEKRIQAIKENINEILDKVNNAHQDERID